MTRIIFLVAMAVGLNALGGCSLWKKDKQPKSSAHLYEGDAPTITYSDRPEAAGGPINPY